MTTEVIIENIRRKVERLMDDNRNLSASFRKACSQRDKGSKRKNRLLKERMADMQRRMNTLELAESLRGGGSDKKIAKAHINRLMREVDRCIALLGKTEQA
ncbi:MAG: hypothetical protein L6V35_05630 [Alistipes putredinis]|nr:MAG: hypothetical protein L6V35_05630 [Alistipes putredinis]